MDREEAKRIYKEKTSVYFQEGMKLLQKNWDSKKDELMQTILQELLYLFSLNSDKEQIQYAQISLLRSQMDTDNYKMLLSLHNENFFLDPNPRMRIIDVSNVFAPLRDTRKKFYNSIGEYQGKIEYFDADWLIREAAMSFYKKQADGCRMLFRDLRQWGTEKGVLPWKRLVVKWGGFQEESETIYLTDTSEKNQPQFLAYNRKNSVSEWDSQYVYQSWETVCFTDMTVQRMNLLFLMLRNCSMDRCQWENCMVHGAGFQNSKINQTNFVCCDLSGCDFRDVEFNQVQFIQCNLTGADFTGAKFDMIQFPNSQMEGAKFSRNGLYCKGLDANQLQQVQLEEEPYVF